MPLLLALVAGAVPATSGAAIDWKFGRGKWTGGVGLRYDQSSQSRESDSSSLSTSSRNLREWFYLRGSGLYVLDPRLVNASLGLQLGLNQNSYSGSYSDSSAADQAIGYNLDASILEQKPYPMQLYANRSQTEANQDFGARTEGTFENVGFSLRLKEDSFLQNWGGPWLSADLRVRQERRHDTTTYFERVSQRDQSQSTVEVSADKGFTTADLRFRYLANELSNAEQPSNRSQSANLFYTQDFGPGLNRNFGSSLSYSTHSGLLPSNTLAATGTLHIAHLTNLSTDYSYIFSNEEIEGVSTTQHSGSFSLSHRLYENLMTSVALSGNQITLPVGTLTNYSGQLSQSYQHSLPGGGGLSMNWSGGYQRDVNALSVGVVNFFEQVEATALDQVFKLSKTFVIESSIRVFNVQDALDIRELALGTDYTVERVGNDVYITLIQDPLSPDPPVALGDKLRVTYDFELDPSLEYETLNAGYGVAVDYGWIGATYQHQQSERTPLVGEARFLNSTSSDSFGLSLRGGWRGLQTTARANHVRSIRTDVAGQTQEDTTRLSLQGSGRMYEMDALGNASLDRYRAPLQAYDRAQVTASLRWRPANNWDMAFSADAIKVRYQMPDSQTTTLTARSSINWRTSGGWNNTAFVGVANSTGSGGGNTSVLQVGARTRWGWGQLALSSGVTFDYLTTGGTQSASQRFDIAITRSFR
ncbi:hypothetical protein [Rhodoferax sp.]|uniref:hypothetical protein n=1 Tax=Rhodoferax sp. TaxID=50421 RepID=UPI0026325EC2|nr:hypothetical protein [Rhodoferax sp.]MDD2918864.1 hypothetical protein [Rhodoferax sp.]